MGALLAVGFFDCVLIMFLMGVACMVFIGKAVASNGTAKALAGKAATGVAKAAAERVFKGMRG